jgi:hypothetical protein
MRSSRTCYQCGKEGHFIADCLEEIEAKNNYKHRSRHKHKYKKKHQRRSKKGGSYGKKKA